VDVETLQKIINFRITQWLYAVEYADHPLDPTGTEPHRAAMRYADGRGGEQTDMSYENAVRERLGRILPYSSISPLENSRSFC